MSETTTPLWNRVTIIGCGLIGASFALALRECGACARFAGWDISAAALDEALKRGVIDEVDQSFAERRDSTSDLVYLAMPVCDIIAFLRGGCLGVAPGATVTDAGSTKVEVCRAARERLPGGLLFVGGHPVSGSHHAGVSHARADLFRGAPYVLTAAHDEQDRRFVALVRTLSAIGARVELMTDEAHDHAMALVSHLPQLLASALAATVNSRADADALHRLSGSGYRDTTRLAASQWPMWRDILATNRAPVADALGAVIEKLSGVRDDLEAVSARGADELKAARALFERARTNG